MPPPWPELGPGPDVTLEPWGPQWVDHRHTAQVASSVLVRGSELRTLGLVPEQGGLPALPSGSPPKVSWMEAKGP